ncbi:acid protease [Panus rudis PR-1116 ss-1]|nr:acid protease [Panus rudis PR-1116 ss-1]
MQQMKMALPENIENAKDVVYATNITVAGQEFPIQLDTGSSDLWFKTPFDIPFTETTNISVDLKFGIGQASGHIARAPVSLGPYHVENQAIMKAENTTDFGAIFNNGIFGILGLAFDQSSNVFLESLLTFGRNDTSGRTFLGNIFAQNKQAPNMFAVTLGRKDDPEGDDDGVFTIGEYDPEFQDVASQPKLDRTPAQLHNLTTQPRWSVQMDKMVVNGQEFQFNQSCVSEAAPGKTVMVLDTGFTFSQFPPAAVDFIYGSIPGAVKNETSGIWTVPCDCTTKLEFFFGGQSYLVHPLDISVVKNVNGQAVCQSTFRNLNIPPEAAGSDIGFDGILGVPFLKNVYTSFDFGDITDDGTLGVPFVQMLTTTPSLDEALTEFRSTRPKQVASIQQSASTSTASAGSLDLDDPGLNSIKFDTFKSEVPLQRRGRMLFTTATRESTSIMPVRFRFRFGLPVHRIIANASQTMRHCAHRVAKSRPVVIALLFGSLVIALASILIGTILLARYYWRNRQSQEEGYYEPIFVVKEEEEEEYDSVYV